VTSGAGAVPVVITVGDACDGDAGGGEAGGVDGDMAGAPVGAGGVPNDESSNFGVSVTGSSINW
jgi:hypothetical protein